MGRAKTIIQLKPRNPDCLLKTSIPIKAICDYRQIEVLTTPRSRPASALCIYLKNEVILLTCKVFHLKKTHANNPKFGYGKRISQQWFHLAILFFILNQITIYKDDECVLANNSHRAKWKVISPTGNEAMVPSVCFTVPPPNKEAVDFANRFVCSSQKQTPGLGSSLKVKEITNTLSRPTESEGSKTSKHGTFHTHTHTKRKIVVFSEGVKSFICVSFHIFQNWAAVPGCPNSLAWDSCKHEECGILALSHQWDR